MPGGMDMERLTAFWDWGICVIPRGAEFYLGMFFSVAPSGLKSFEIYEPGVTLRFTPGCTLLPFQGFHFKHPSVF